MNNKILMGIIENDDKKLWISDCNKFINEHSIYKTEIKIISIINNDPMKNLKYIAIFYFWVYK